MICDVLLSSLDGGSRSWNFQFQRAFHDCELEDMLAFFKLIYSKLPSGVGVDGLSWSLTRSGTFDVCTFITVSVVLSSFLSLGGAFGI